MYASDDENSGKAQQMPLAGKPRKVSPGQVLGSCVRVDLKYTGHKIMAVGRRPR